MSCLFTHCFVFLKILAKGRETTTDLPSELNFEEDTPGRSLLQSKLDKATCCSSYILDLSAVNPEVCS